MKDTNITLHTWRKTFTADLDTLTYCAFFMVEDKELEEFLKSLRPGYAVEIRTVFGSKLCALYRYEPEERVVDLKERRENMKVLKGRGCG